MTRQLLVLSGRPLLLLAILLTGCADESSSPDAGITDRCPGEQPAQGSECNYVNPLAGLCYYYDECTDDHSGVIASCTDGKWSIARNHIKRGCPATAPAIGERCPCAEGGRQETPCEYSCGGATAIARCDRATLTWTFEGGARCVRGDGGT